MAVIELDSDNFAATLAGSTIAVLDFWAPWCGPCRMFAPIFESTADEHPDVLFGKINTEEQEALAAHFNIRSIPTLMLVRENVLLYSQAGALAKQALNELITQAKALDMDKVRSELAAGEDN